ncbi:MAG: hypothetical protein U5L11_05090 [Arhodomonas sp.]|nr:hypothetical protein [Arhodomonas sp.]
MPAARPRHYARSRRGKGALIRANAGDPALGDAHAAVLLDGFPVEYPDVV